MMKTSMRHCWPCNKTTKHSITEEEIKSTLKKEIKTCTQCKITLSRVISTYDKDKIIHICYQCKEKTIHFKGNWYNQCTVICGVFRKMGL